MSKVNVCENCNILNFSSVQDLQTCSCGHYLYSVQSYHDEESMEQTDLFQLTEGVYTLDAY